MKAALEELTPVLVLQPPVLLRTTLCEPARLGYLASVRGEKQLAEHGHVEIERKRAMDTTAEFRFADRASGPEEYYFGGRDTFRRVAPFTCSLRSMSSTLDR